MKKALPYLGTLLIGVILGALLFRPSGPDPAYWVERAEYDQQTKDMEAGLQESFRILAERDKTIALQDEFVALSQRKIIELEATQTAQAKAGMDLKAENARLKADAQAAIDANPAVKALVENFELRCANYEEQIFSLVQRDAERVRIIEAKDVQLVAVAYQRDTWKKAWEDEHALRLACDSLRLDLEKMPQTSSFERAATDVQELGVGAYSAIKYKDPLPLAAWAAKKGIVKVWKLLHK